MNWARVIVIAFVALTLVGGVGMARADCPDGNPNAQLVVYLHNDPDNYGDDISYTIYWDGSQYHMALEDVSNFWDGEISSLECRDGYATPWSLYDDLNCSAELLSDTGTTAYVGDDSNDKTASLEFHCPSDKGWTPFTFCQHSNGGGEEHPLKLFKTGNSSGVVMSMRLLDGFWNDEISAIEVAKNGALPKAHTYWYFYKDVDFNNGGDPDLVMHDNESNWALGDLNDKITSFRLVISDSDTAPTLNAVPPRSLEVSVAGVGTVTVSPELPEYATNAPVELAAVPGVNSVFAGWRGDATGPTNPLTVTMDTSKRIVAEFFSALPSISIDGTNDFDAGSLVDDDAGDTQEVTCSDPVRPLDLGRIYLTNDASYLYFGFEYRRWCFNDINLGMALDVNSPEGGTTDPFGRKIGWADGPFKPDFVLYDVVPTSVNTYNYEVLYSWNTATNGWVAVHGGPNGMGIADADGGDFVEGRILLADLGVSAGDTIHVEWWVTQEGTTKGPLDASFGDAVQMSRNTSTNYDTTAVVEMPGMHPWTILHGTGTPPMVRQALAVDFPVLTDKTIGPSTNRVEVQFDEAVGPTADVAANFTYSGPVARNVVAAARDPYSPTVVHLTLDADITANGAFHDITVTGIKDLAGNPIVANGMTNVGSFYIQSVTFNGDMRSCLRMAGAAAGDTYAVEGSIAPLTFRFADNARMYDIGLADSVYVTTVPFALPRDRGTGKAEANLQWRFTHTPAPDLLKLEKGPHRILQMSSDHGPEVAVHESWDPDLVGVPLEPMTTPNKTDFAVLRQSYPNPISASTSIFFDLNRGGRVTLTIYDVAGRRVARILDRILEPGPQLVEWDGRGADGVRIGSGVYVYELASGRDRVSRRMVLAR